jgi:hypothetical protein
MVSALAAWGSVSVAIIVFMLMLITFAKKQDEARAKDRLAIERRLSTIEGIVRVILRNGHGREYEAGD